MDECIACLPPMDDRASGLYSARAPHTRPDHKPVMQTHTLQAMQALHTPVKHGLHHTSQLLPSCVCCVYYMV